MSRIKAFFVSLYHYFLVVLNIYLLDLIFSCDDGSFLAIAPAVALGIAKMGASGIQMIQQDAAQKAATIEAGRLGRSIANRRFINKFAALQAPTKGTEMLMERVMRQSQAATEASKEAGARGVIGGTGRTVQAVTDAGAQIAARLDDLQLKLDNKFLTEEQRIGLMNEKKNLQLDYQRLAGAQRAAAAAGTASNQALAGLVGGAGEVIAGGIEASDLYRGGKSIEEIDVTSGDFSKELQEDIDQLSPETDKQRLARLDKYRKSIDVEGDMARDLDIIQDLNREPIYENLNVNTPYDMSGLQGAFQLGEENLVKDPLTGLMITKQ
jgi:hypothetical protein|tara:strand:- start:5564 stop:6535 length:972 start_codon:yes stop_codon:yes gene_type:complete